MKKVTGEDMFRRYEYKDPRDVPGAEHADMPRVAQAQIGRRLGTMLWTPDQDLPEAFEQAIQKIKKSLS